MTLYDIKRKIKESAYKIGKKIRAMELEKKTEEIYDFYLLDDKTLDSISKSIEEDRIISEKEKDFMPMTRISKKINVPYNTLKEFLEQKTIGIRKKEEPNRRILYSFENIKKLNSEESIEERLRKNHPKKNIVEKIMNMNPKLKGHIRIEELAKKFDIGDSTLLIAINEMNEKTDSKISISYKKFDGMNIGFIHNECIIKIKKFMGLE